MESSEKSLGFAGGGILTRVAVHCNIENCKEFCLLNMAYYVYTFTYVNLLCTFIRYSSRGTSRVNSIARPPHP